MIRYCLSYLLPDETMWCFTSEPDLPDWKSAQMHKPQLPFSLPSLETEPMDSEKCRVWFLSSWRDTLRDHDLLETTFLQWLQKELRECVSTADVSSVSVWREESRALLWDITPLIPTRGSAILNYSCQLTALALTKEQCPRCTIPRKEEDKIQVQFPLVTNSHKQHPSRSSSASSCWWAVEKI